MPGYRRNPITLRMIDPAGRFGMRPGPNGAFLCACVLFMAGTTHALASPEFSLPALEGQEKHSLSDFHGRTVYLDFWASWCGPCRKSLPLYESVQQEFGGPEFTVVAISLDEDPDDARGFLHDHPVTYPVLIDSTGDTAAQWQIKAMPSSYLLDASGRVVRSWAGFEPEHIEEIRDAIRAQLQ